MIDKISKCFEQHVPAEAVRYCIALWTEQNFTFKLSRSRSTKLGDYRYEPKTQEHYISVNRDLNKYSFLITYLHEVAHLITFEKFGRKVKPHGREWKQNFRQLMLPMLNDAVFPDAILKALARHLKNPKASSCNDHNLMMTINAQMGHEETYLSQVPSGVLFKLNNRVFRKDKLRRTRYLCEEVSSGKRYLISKMATIEVLS